jgi:hypothetical protein
MQNTGDNRMKPKNIVALAAGLVLLLTGCSSVSLPLAVAGDGTIQNASLGFSGFSFKIPAGFTLYSPADIPADGYTPLQQLAIRIYEQNERWHPRGNELFYESFMLLSDQTCFLLITLKVDDDIPAAISPFWDDPVSQWELLPCYNVTSSRSFSLGETRQPAVCTAGSAYEQKGWYYAGAKRNSTPFSCEICKISGGNRDRYILAGFALPEQAGELTAPMQQMLDAISFSLP